MCKQPILACHRRMLSHREQTPDNAPLVPTDKQRKNRNIRPILKNKRLAIGGRRSFFKNHPRILKNKRLAVCGCRPFFRNRPPILKNGATNCKRKLKAICISPADVLSL